MQNKNYILRFFKYSIVGGISFIADFFVLVFITDVLFPEISWVLYLGTAFGFLAGLTVNHLLCVKFVFKSRVSFKENVKKFRYSFFIGLTGFMLTEIGMFLGTQFIHISYGIVKIFMTAVVFIWNYLAREFFVFRERG